MKDHGITGIGGFSEPLGLSAVHKTFLTIAEGTGISACITTYALTHFFTEIGPSFL
jgi:hypothetical protein